MRSASSDVNTPQIELTLDRKKAEALGVPVKRVFAALAV